MAPRTEPCPDCGRPISLSTGELRRGRARCASCALDVRLDAREVGDGPERSSSYLGLIAPALAPSSRLRAERDHRHLAITLSPDSNVTAATVGLVGALALVGFGAVNVVPLLVAALAFVCALAIGFVLASRERVRYALIVEHASARLNGQPLALPLPDDLSGGVELTASEQRWVREVVTARLAGDEDARR